MLAVALALVQATASPPLAPISKWQMDYAKDQCVLSRAFGDPAKPLVVGFRPFPVSSGGELVLIVSGKVAGGGRSGTGTVTLLPAKEAFPIRWSKEPVDSGRSSIRFFARAEFWDALPLAQAMTLDLGSLRVTLNLGGMKSTMAAAKACTDDLLTQWGVDPAATIRVPLGQGPVWFPADSYPRDARARDEQGWVMFVASFDRQGRPSGCRIVMSSRFEGLDRGTCAVVMKYGRLDAAA